MITEGDIDQALAECRAERDPNGWTAMRWAAFLTIKCMEFGHPDLTREPTAALPIMNGFSYATGPGDGDEIVRYNGKSEFASVIDGQRAAKIWPIMDELMSITQTLHPPIYQRVMDVLK